jgi:hypothetical protein
VLRANREAFHVRIKEISDEHKEELAALEIRVRRLEVDVAVLQQRKPSR